MKISQSDNVLEIGTAVNLRTSVPIFAIRNTRVLDLYLHPIYFYIHLCLSSSPSSSPFHSPSFVSFLFTSLSRFLNPRSTLAAFFLSYFHFFFSLISNFPSLPPSLTHTDPLGLREVGALKLQVAMSRGLHSSPHSDKGEQGPIVWACSAVAPQGCVNNEPRHFNLA